MLEVQSFARRLFLNLGIDAKVGTGIITRIIPILAGPIGSLIIIWTLSAETQGLYYLFASLLAMRSLFDLGIQVAIVQVSAYARTAPSDRENSPLEPEFIHLVRRWMGRLALIYGLFTLGAGVVFLNAKDYGDALTLSAWTLFIVSSTAQFASEGRWALLAGADFVKESNKLRTGNSLVQYLTQWACLLSGLGLFSFCLGSFVAYVVQEKSFRARFAWLYSRSGINPDRVRFFRAELKTLIIRASQTYLTSYFVFQISQPICFYLLGAVESARLGFTQAVGSALIGLPSLWLSMNFPRMVHLVADGRPSEARALFRIRLLQSLAFTIVLVTVAWFGCRILSFWPKFSDRLMDGGSSAIYFAAAGVQTAVLSLTYLPRAFKIEPFVRVAYFQMFLTPALLWVLTSCYHLTGVALAGLASWLIAGVWILWICHPFLKQPETDPSLCR
jgi:hypothetical protein